MMSLPYESVNGKPSDASKFDLYSLIEVDFNAYNSGCIKSTSAISNNSFKLSTPTYNLEELFKDENTKNFAFRVHDAGDDLFLVVESSPEKTLVQRVSFDDSVNNKLKNQKPGDIKSSEAVNEYKNLVEQALCKEEQFGWIPDTTCRCGDRPYVLVPCLVESPIPWLEGTREV
jgi:hypothetical protein